MYTHKSIRILSYIAYLFYYFNRSGTSSVVRTLDCWAGGGLDSRGRTITRSHKVARYSFSMSIPPKFEHKLRHHKQRFGKIATTVVLDKEENFLWSGLQWQKIGNSVISSLGRLRCRCNPDHNKFSLWWQFFQIFVYGDVVYVQTWDLLTLKNCVAPP